MPIKLPHILVLTLGFGLGLILTPSAALAAISVTDLAEGAKSASLPGRGSAGLLASFG